MQETPEQEMERCLKTAKVKKNNFYEPWEMRRILNLGPRKFRQLCERYTSRGTPGRELGIRSEKDIITKHNKVSHTALVEFFEDLHELRKERYG